MNVSELRSRALSTAVDMDLAGFPASAEAFRQLASSLAQEVRLFWEVMGDQAARRDIEVDWVHSDEFRATP